MNKQNNIKKQLKFTQRDSSLIRQLLKIPKVSPLKKSSSMNHFNVIQQVLLDTIQKTILIQGPINKQLWKNQLKPLDFNKYHKLHFRPLFRTCNRYFNHESHLSFLDSLSQIIKIQSNYRCYTSKKQFFLQAKDYIEEKGLNAIVIIQSKVKQFLLLKKLKIDLLQETILGQRKKNFRKIEEKMQEFYIKNKLNLQMIYEDIVRKRTNSAIKFQSIFRQRTVYSNYFSFKEKIKTHFYLLYPFKAEEITLKIFTYENNTSHYKVYRYHFEYDLFLKSFVLFVPFDALPSGKYRCQFIVDRVETCDGRYPHIEFSDGLFYNMIDFIQPNEISMNDNMNNNDDIHDLDDTRTEDLQQLENDLGNLNSKCFFDEIKNFQSHDDFLNLRIDLYGKKFSSNMAEIRNEPFSKIELKFNN